MKWILLTWVLNQHGAPVYQHATMDSEAKCETTYQELIKTPGNKIAGHTCTQQEPTKGRGNEQVPDRAPGRN